MDRAARDMVSEARYFDRNPHHNQRVTCHTRVLSTILNGENVNTNNIIIRYRISFWLQTGSGRAEHSLNFRKVSMVIDEELDIHDSESLGWSPPRSSWVGGFPIASKRFPKQPRHQTQQEPRKSDAGTCQCQSASVWWRFEKTRTSECSEHYIIVK
jgi:hypothetical protein